MKQRNTHTQEFCLVDRFRGAHKGKALQEIMANPKHPIKWKASKVDMAILRRGVIHVQYNEAFSHVICTAKGIDRRGSVWQLHLSNDGDVIAYATGRRAS